MRRRRSKRLFVNLSGKQDSYWTQLWKASASSRHPWGHLVSRGKLSGTQDRDMPSQRPVSVFFHFYMNGHLIKR